jgi:maltose alpha-D-glucosyltransferase / alpha-amylase
VFGTGAFEVLHVANPAVLAFLRREVGEDDSGDIVLCVNNLSKVAQPVEIDLSTLDGKVPVELFGEVAFPPIGELPYFVTLPPYGFYWFSLVDAEGGFDDRGARADGADPTDPQGLAGPSAAPDAR